MSEPAWKRVIDLFEKHGLAPPPVRMRDELVGWLVAYDASKEMKELVKPQ